MNNYVRGILNLTVGSWYFRTFMQKDDQQESMVLSFDPDETIDMEKLPGLLDLLKKYKMKASFAAIGIWVERYPDLWKRLLKEGHEIINHTYSHPDSPELNKNHYHKITRQERKNEISRCHDVVKRVLGIEMQGFRIPHFGVQYTYDTYAILQELGYAFSSSRMATPGSPLGPHMIGDIKEFPLTCCPKHPWTIYDSSHAFRGRYSRHEKEEFLEDFSSLIDSGLFLNIYLDPQDLHKFAFEDMLKLVQKKGIKTNVYEDLL